ncbi:RagB/SusD family nutrient uptake outer membrane protein [Foetidibacter luteolus]|uniref:RagB/SusD family nutrient uptake outer membrane protein n=1 Tax=Foetidibacter luteolus TaxID=2608880 RepID=UPI001A99D196|nr:RagB/SusD family nutrient uptake outer membrane protein [Foetidibacter luteolus]
MNKFLLAGLMSVGLISCSKNLEIQSETSLSPEQLLTTSDGVVSVLYGGYSTLVAGSCYGTDFIMAGELLAGDGDIFWRGTFQTYRDIFNKQQIAVDPTAQRMWINSYKAINSLNNVLKAISVVNEDIRDNIEGEAKFLRGLYYFNLIQYFAQPWSKSAGNDPLGVPLILQPVENLDNLQVSRNSVKEVYDQVISDLSDAKAKLPESNDNGRADKSAASAILSRVYLQQANYAGAAAEANAVIEFDETLAPSVSVLFNNSGNSAEDIFAVQQNSQVNVGSYQGVGNGNDGLVTFFASLPGVGRGDVDIQQAHINKYSNGDDRKALFYLTQGNGQNANAMRSSKWRELYKVITVVRRAEMYLTRAEANYRNSSAVGASPLDDINAVRTRANVPPLANIANADVIVNERLLELAFEGDKLWTLKRLKKNIGTRAYDDSKLVLPIPQRERDANPNIAQNPTF